MEIELNDDGAKLLEKLVELGGRTNNAALRNKLTWDKDKYFEVRNHCKAAGLIGLSRGRGGIVFLTDSARSALAEISILPKEEADKLAEEVERESEYYERLLPKIKKDWVQNEGFDDFIVEVTAHKRTKGAGRWTVPDIVVIGKSVRQYVPGMVFTVQSIEVKRFEASDALSVFEALSHRRAAHYSYLLLVNHPKKPSERDGERLAQITQLCEEHDVGLATINKGEEGNYDCWEFHIDASERFDPDPYALDGFIKQHISAEGKELVAKMVR